MEPLGPGKGDMILSPTWTQYVSSQQAMQQSPGSDSSDGAPPPAGFDGSSQDDFSVEPDSGAPSADDFEVSPPLPGGGDDDRVTKSLSGGRVIRYEIDTDSK